MPKVLQTSPPSEIRGLVAWHQEHQRECGCDLGWVGPIGGQGLSIATVSYSQLWLNGMPKLVDLPRVSHDGFYVLLGRKADPGRFPFLNQIDVLDNTVFTYHQLTHFIIPELERLADEAENDNQREGALKVIELARSVDIHGYLVLFGD